MSYKNHSGSIGVREFFKVVPTTASESNSDIDKHLTSLGDLTRATESGSNGLLGIFGSSPSGDPVTFEFLAFSQGENEPVELYYSSDGRQETLEKRLKAIYPSSFDVTKVHLDLGHQLVKPIELTEEEFRARLKSDQLYLDREEYLDKNIEGELVDGTTGQSQLGDGPAETVDFSQVDRPAIEVLRPHDEHEETETEDVDTEIFGSGEANVQSDGGTKTNSDDQATGIQSDTSDNSTDSAPPSVVISNYRNSDAVNPIAIFYSNQHRTTFQNLDGDPLVAPSTSADFEPIDTGTRVGDLIEPIDLSADTKSKGAIEKSGTESGDSVELTLPHYPEGVNPIIATHKIRKKSTQQPGETENKELQVGDNTIEFRPHKAGQYIAQKSTPNTRTVFAYVGTDNDDGDEDGNKGNEKEDISETDSEGGITENGEQTGSSFSEAPLKQRAPSENEIQDSSTDEGTDKPPLAGSNSDSTSDSMLIIDDEEEDGTPIQGIVQLNPPEDIPDNEPIVTLDGPTRTEDGTIYARPSLEYTDPNAVKWYGKETNPLDWMTTLNTATESNPEYEDGVEEDDVDSPDALETLFSHLEDASNPTAYQAVFQQKPSWEHEARSFKQDVRRGEFNEPLLEKLFPTSTEEDRDLKAYEYRRIKLVENKRPTETFNVNLRAISLKPKADFSHNTDDNPHEEQAEINDTLHALTPLFDPVDGIYYSIEGEVADKKKPWLDFSLDLNAGQIVTNFFNRDLALRSNLRGPLTPFNLTNDPKKHVELVMNGRELGEFIIIPSGEDMDDDVFRSTGVRDEDIEPLTRPRPEIHRKFKTGMALGYAYDEHGRIEDKPTCLPEGKLRNHWAMFGSSGSGKTVNAISMLLSAHRDTDGPVILVDPKEGNMVENYMKSHYGTFGDLRDVYVFSVPDVLPAVPFFDIRPYLYEGMDRDNAIQQKVDEFHLILQMVDENYDTAYVAKTVLGALIKSQFDAEHGADAFTLDDLYATAVDMYSNQRVPRVSHQPQVRNILTNQLNNSESEFKNTMQAVINRLDDLQEDINLYHLFNQNPTWDNEEGVYVDNGVTLDQFGHDDPEKNPSKPPRNALDFRKILDEDVVVLFDTGDFVRDQSQRAFSMYILSALWGRVRSRYKDNRSHETIDSTVKLVIEESAPIVSTELVTNTLIPEGREFGLSLGMIMQFPDQVSSQGVQGSFNELKTNVQTKIYGQIDPNRKIADSLVHDGKDASSIKSKIRRLRGGEWVAQLPEPEFGVDVPPPFSLRSLDIPPGHPESNQSFDDSQRRNFYRLSDQRFAKTANHHGITQAERSTDLSEEDNDDLTMSTGDESDTDPADTDPADTDDTLSEDTLPSEDEADTDTGWGGPGTDGIQGDDGDGADGNASGGLASQDTAGQTTSGNSAGGQADAQPESPTMGDDGQTTASAETPATNTTSPSDNGGGKDGSESDSEPQFGMDDLNPTGSADGDHTQSAANETPDSQAASSNSGGSSGGIYSTVSPIKRSAIAGICDSTDFTSLDSIQAAVFDVEERYHPVKQVDRFQQAVKRLAIEAQAHGHDDLTADDLVTSANQSGASPEQNGDGTTTTVDDVDATDDVGPDIGGLLDDDSDADDSRSDANETPPPDTNADGDGTTGSGPSGDGSGSETTSVDDTGWPDEATPPDMASDQSDARGETEVEAEADTGKNESVKGDESPASPGQATQGDSEGGDEDDELGNSLEEMGYTGEEKEALKQTIQEFGDDGSDASVGSSSEPSGDGTTPSAEDTQQEPASDEADGESEADDGSDKQVSPAEVSIESPLSDNTTLLTKHKRESVDISRDDIEFLALVGDAFRDELDDYALTESMSGLSDRAGNPDIAALKEQDYVEDTTVLRRKYYSLTRKGWRLINDGVPGNKFGDHMEKIEHRVGVYLMAERLGSLPGVTAAQYEEYDGETFDVIGYDANSNIRHVCEVETSSNNKQAVLEDYDKLRHAPGMSTWAFPDGDVMQDVWSVLKDASHVGEIPTWNKQRASRFKKYVREHPHTGIRDIWYYSKLKDEVEE